MIKVIHVTPHLSGGLARVLLSTLKYTREFTPGISHEIVSIEDFSCETKSLFTKFENRLHIRKSYEFIAAKMVEADIVQLEWWNHPLIYKFLSEFQFPPSRILVCCHVSGLFRPQIITEKIVQFADIFLPVTKATSKHELFQKQADHSLIQKLRYIQFPVDIGRFNVKKTTQNGQFKVGYVGTVNYSKLHRKFLNMCSHINIPNVEFLLCGEDIPDNIELESKNYNSQIFKFLGFKKDISSVLNQLDVFGYPLNDTHFGSGEQAIIESMFFGLPVVAFNNAAEAEIIENQVTGILVNSEDEYIEAIEYLHRNPERRLKMGENAKFFIESQLSPQYCFQKLDDIYRELMLKPKSKKIYNSSIKNLAQKKSSISIIGARLFLEAMGNKGKEFQASLENQNGAQVRTAESKIANVESAMKTMTKGSLIQYLHFFPEDPYLNLWIGLFKQKENNHIEATKHFNRALQLNNELERVKVYLEVSHNQI
jgi:glycosyltransferase involved in cell wall biosynthesis